MVVWLNLWPQFPRLAQSGGRSTDRSKAQVGNLVVMVT
jgi:hypothetical protein